MSLRTGTLGSAPRCKCPRRLLVTTTPRCVSKCDREVILLFLQRVQYEQGSQFSAQDDVKGGEAKVGSDSGAAAKGGEAKKQKNNP